MSIVDWLLTPEAMKRSQSQVHIGEVIGITWKMTDSVIEEVRGRARKNWIPGTQNLLSMVEFKLAKFRGSSIYAGVNPVNVIRFYLDLCDAIERRCLTMDSVSHNKLVSQQLPSVSYALFVRGMSRRFAELAFGTVYVR